MFIETKLNWFNQYLTNLEIGLAALAHNKLSPSLIPPTSLLRVLSHIAGNSLDGWHLSSSSKSSSEPDIFQIYRDAKVFSAIEEGRLKLFISIPLIQSSHRHEHLQSKLVLFRVHNLPVSVGPNNSVRVVHLPDFLAVSSINDQFADSFVELTESQVKDCALSRSIRPIYCPFQNVAIVKQKSDSIGSCAMSIFTDDSDGEKKWCRHQPVELAESDAAVYLGARRWAVSAREPQTIKYYCPDVNKNMGAIHNFLPVLSIIRIPIGCSGFTEKWEFPASYSDIRSSLEVFAKDTRPFFPVSIMPNLTSGLYSANSLLKSDSVAQEEIEKLLQENASLIYLAQMSLYVTIATSILAMSFIVFYLFFIRKKLNFSSSLKRIHPQFGETTGTLFS